MQETLWYMAHPVAGDVKANAARALRWLAWLRKQEPGAVICAPWLAALLSGDDDSDPAVRARAIRECEAVAQVFDAIVLVGGCISTGMRRELDIIAGNGGQVCDLTRLGAEPPSNEVIEQMLVQARVNDPYSPVSTVLGLGAAIWEVA